MQCNNIKALLSWLDTIAFVVESSSEHLFAVTKNVSRMTLQEIAYGWLECYLPLLFSSKV